MRLITEQVVRGGLSEQQAVEQLDQRVDKILAKRRWIQQQVGKGPHAEGVHP